MKGRAGRRRLDYLHVDHRRLTAHGVALAVLVGAGLAVAALMGLSWTAGVGAVLIHLRHTHWGWLAAGAGGLAVSYVGYLLAYREVVRTDGGPHLDAAHAAALVATGFGVFIPRGGFAFDHSSWCQHGLDEREAHRRVLSLAVLEYAVLAPATLGAALWLLLEHVPAQAGVLPSWAIGVPAGAVVTLGLLALRRRIGRRRFKVGPHLARGLDAVTMTMGVLRSPGSALRAGGGMALYWAGDMTALAVCLIAVAGRCPSIPVLIVGYSTGYALTRRSLPLAGAGAVEALLPVALSWMSIPLAAAVPAVFAYRLLNLWLPLVPAAIGVRHLRQRDGIVAGEEMEAERLGPRRVA